MANEIFLDGKQYISSKRASELSGYTQDYVGQLARGGEVDARRIGGLWYVHFESLQSYKSKADAYTPIPPQRIAAPQQPHTVVSFDGKDYVSANRGSEMSGYHQDYIGQLARSGKISSRQVGNRWFVDRQALLDHKEEKDSLLAAVQTESVGIQRPTQAASFPSHDEEFFTYTTDDGDLIPAIGKEEPEDEQTGPQYSTQEPRRSVIEPLSPVQHTRVPIRIIAPAAPRFQAEIKPPQRLSPPIAARSIGPVPVRAAQAPAIQGKSSLGRYVLIGASAFTVVIFVFVGFISVQQKATFAFGGGAASSMNAAAANALQTLSERIEDLLGHQLDYQKSQ